MLPQTRVRAVQNSTQLRREAVSDASGDYNIPQLPVGIHTVTFEHQGFKTLEFLDLEQVIGATRTLDTRLQAADGEERVNVSSASALIDRDISAVPSSLILPTPSASPASTTICAPLG